MAYQIKKNKRIEHQLELCDEDGEVLKLLEVKINIKDLVGPFRKKQIEILELEKEHRENRDDVIVLEKLCQSITSFIQLIFGKEQTEILLEYYENDELKMFSELLPFIQEVVAPAIHSEVKCYREMVGNNSNLSKKQQRRLNKM